MEVSSDVRDMEDASSSFIVVVVDVVVVVAVVIKLGLSVIDPFSVYVSRRRPKRKKETKKNINRED